MNFRTGQLRTAAPSWTREVDVVIVGTGGAGLSALLPLAGAGLRVDVVTKAELTDSATDWAQGGLAAVWDPADSFEAHAHDTHVAGVDLCDDVAVQTIVSEAPDAIQALYELGAKFDKDATGRYDLHREGGHSARRIVHADGDASGHEVERALATATDTIVARTPQVHLHEGTALIDVLTDERGDSCGVAVLDPQGAVGHIIAPAVILATGGAGQLWPLTSNPPVATADGVGAALRAGASVRDVEFMQFHPTVLALPARFVGDRGVLISEAVRGEGAFLRDEFGRKVMEGKHPQADLAPRDVVSATMFAHMREHGLPHLLLDATAFGEQAWQHHFPTILELCRERGIDPVTEAIPVRPGAHYHCGGISVDLDGRTSIPGLYAVGECAATGLHGANRLASNSVPEAVILGTRCGKMLVGDRLGFETTYPVPRQELNLVAPEGRASLHKAADEGLGVSRTEAGMKAAADVIGSLATTSTLTRDALEMTNLATLACVIAASATRRSESRGCHRRADFPHTDEAWRVRLVATLSKDGVNLSSIPLGPKVSP